MKDHPSPLILGVNCDAVMLIHPDKQNVLEIFPFTTTLITWGHSDEKFFLVTGDIQSQKKLIFRTVHGKEINQLVHEYVNYKAKGAQKK